MNNTNLNRYETTALKNVAKQFESIRPEIVKCREYSELTDDFLIHAYALAKAIHQKYNYKITKIDHIKKIFDSLGITLHIDQNFIQSDKKSTSDSCTITFLEGEISISIKYSTIDLSNNRSLYYSYNYLQDNSVFCYFYALAIVILFYDKLETEGSMTFYCEESEENIYEGIAKCVTLLLFYINYDYGYRVKKYPYTCFKNGQIVKELADIHPRFSIPRYNSYLEQTIPQIHDVISSDGSTEYTFDHLKTINVIQMLLFIHKLNTKFNKDYKELSKMMAPEELYSLYKNRDYTTF